MSSMALFDFDGTLTHKDSMVDFINFAKGKYKMVTGAIVLSPILLRYKLKIIDNGRAKESVLRYFFNGFDAKEFSQIGNNYALKSLPKIIRSDGLKRLHWHIKEKHKVVIVSASPEKWLKAWTETIGADLIGTLLEEKDGKLTGKYNGQNCHGQEKVRRIKQCFNLDHYDKIYAYGDTPGDYPMLKLADEAFYGPIQS